MIRPAVPTPPELQSPRDSYENILARKERLEKIELLRGLVAFPLAFASIFWLMPLLVPSKWYFVSILTILASDHVFRRWGLEKRRDNLEKYRRYIEKKFERNGLEIYFDLNNNIRVIALSAAASTGPAPGAGSRSPEVP